MTEAELIKKLTELKEIKPDANWVIFCRQNLSQRIITERPVKKESLISKLNSVRFFAFNWPSLFPPVLVKPAIILLVIFSFVFGTGLVAVAKAKQSLPGDRLYPVKIALEKAELLITVSADGKAEVRNEIMASRLEELNRILSKQEPNEQKQRKVEEAVTNLQRQLVSIKEGLPSLEKIDSKKLVEMAKKIDANAAQAQQALNQAKAVAPSDNLTKKIAEASEEADKTSDKVLEVLVAQTKDGQGVNQEEILAKLDEKIQKTEQKIKGVEETVSISVTDKEFPINANLILDQSDKAKEVLEQARERLRQNDFIGAFQIIQAANQMVKSAERLIESITPLEQPAAPEQEPSSAPDSNFPATSTSSSIIEIPSQSTVLETTPSTSIQGSSVSVE